MCSLSLVFWILGGFQGLAAPPFPSTQGAEPGASWGREWYRRLPQMDTRGPGEHHGPPAPACPHPYALAFGPQRDTGDRLIGLSGYTSYYTIQGVNCVHSRGFIADTCMQPSLKPCCFLPLRALAPAPVSYYSCAVPMLPAVFPTSAVWPVPRAPRVRSLASNCLSIRYTLCPTTLCQQGEDDTQAMLPTPCRLAAMVCLNSSELDHSRR